MGLVNARNLRKAKELLEKNRDLLEKNRHKLAPAVEKATTKLDEVSGGKTSNLSRKAEEAARKYSDNADTPADASVVANVPGDSAAATLAAADALTEAANEMLATAAKMRADVAASAADRAASPDRDDQSATGSGR